MPPAGLREAAELAGVVPRAHGVAEVLAVQACEGPVRRRERGALVRRHQQGLLGAVGPAQPGQGDAEVVVGFRKVVHAGDGGQRCVGGRAVVLAAQVRQREAVQRTRIVRVQQQRLRVGRRGIVPLAQPQVGVADGHAEVGALAGGAGQ